MHIYNSEAKLCFRRERGLMRREEEWRVHTWDFFDMSISNFSRPNIERKGDLLQAENMVKDVKEYH
jgi:hypothetical protein